MASRNQWRDRSGRDASLEPDGRDSELHPLQETHARRRDNDREPDDMRDAEDDGDRFSGGESGRGYGGHESRRGRPGGDYGREYSSNYGRDYASDYERGYGRSYGTGYGGAPDEPGGAFGRESTTGRGWRGYRTGYGPGTPYRGRLDEPGVDYRGLGPRGYTRSDERIREDVCDRLSDDPLVDASDVEVSVSHSEITLSGTVSSREQKRRAEDCADDVPGVMHVQNNLRVNTQPRERDK
jgi:hypothetical protein